MAERALSDRLRALSFLRKRELSKPKRFLSESIKSLLEPKWCWNYFMAGGLARPSRHLPDWEMGLGGVIFLCFWTSKTLLQNIFFLNFDFLIGRKSYYVIK